MIEKDKTAATTAGRPVRAGVLALQGDFAAHARALEEAGAEVREVRTPDDLQGLDGLVLPGGESTALLRLLRPAAMDEAIRRFHQGGGALFGTCAGVILLASRVTHPDQEGLGLIDLTVERNAYGRQVESFVAEGRLVLPNGNGDAATDVATDATTAAATNAATAGAAGEPSEMVFIRAPRIVGVGPAVRVLGSLRGDPVLVLQGRILAATYHPEMSADRKVHQFFLRLAAEGRARL